MPAATKKAKTATAKKATKQSVKKTAKKVTKKAPAKKAAAKKVTAKKGATKSAKKGAKKTAKKKPLVVAEGEKAFWTTNGQVLDSLVALRDALDEMEREVFSYHVRDSQNDFAVWVSEVLCDADCAAELAAASTPNKAKTVVVRHLNYYAV